MLFLVGGSPVLGNIVLTPLPVLADTGFYLSAREVTLGSRGATTTSPELSPITGAAVRFFSKNPKVGDIAVYASFSSDSGAGSGPKTGSWDVELYDVTNNRPVSDSQDIQRYMSGLYDQGMIGLCSLFTGLKRNVIYEVRLRHATSAGTLRTKNLNMVVLPLFSGRTISLNHAVDTSTKGVTTNSARWVDTDLKSHIFLDPGVTGAYILITAAINSETYKGSGRAGFGTWKIRAGQDESYSDFGVPVQRYFSGKIDIGSVVLHALAGPFDADGGKISFKVQHKSNKRVIRTFNGTLLAIALSSYDSITHKQYDYPSGQHSNNRKIATTSNSLIAVYNPDTGNRVAVFPNLTGKTRLFLGANFNNTTPLPATVTYDIAEGDSSQAQKVKRVTGTNDVGAGSLFSISDTLYAGKHNLGLRHATTSTLNTFGANLVYVILGYDEGSEQ